jgi:transposase
MSFVSDRKPYNSDLSDAQWDLIRPVISAWKAAHPSVSGHSGRYEMREIVNAIRYVARNGIPWAEMPHDLPPKSAAYYYFATWRDDGTDEKIHDLLRWQVREKAGRAADPTATALDTQSLHAAVNVPAATTGRDAAKRVPGRKRGLAVDVIGLIIAVVVTAASVTDNVIGKRLLDKVTVAVPTVTKAWVDAGFKDDVAIHGALLGVDVEVVSRADGEKGFRPLPFRWVVEQVNGTLMLHRRLVRDYEIKTESAESMVYWASSDLMSKRLTGENTPTWRGL